MSAGMSGDANCGCAGLRGSVAGDWGREQPNIVVPTPPLPPPLAQTVFTALGCQEPITLYYIQVALQAVKLFDGKQHDYGSENIAAFGEKGVVVRMNDKMARLRRLVWLDEPAVNEAIEDSYADIGVYSVIARLCRAGKWPGVPGIKPRPSHKSPWDSSAYATYPEDLDSWRGSGLSTAAGTRVEVVETYERGPRVGARGTVMQEIDPCAGYRYRVDFDEPFPGGNATEAGRVGWLFSTLVGTTDGITIRPVGS